MEKVTFNGPEQASPDIAREGEGRRRVPRVQGVDQHSHSSLTTLEGVSRRLLDRRMVADR
jgi:hypothetical protein